MERDNGAALRRILVGVLVLLALDGAVNLALHDSSRWPLWHALFELFSILVAMGAAVVLWLGWWNAAQTVKVVQRSLENRQAERDAWRERARRALHGLGAAIDAQFAVWHLTPTEREIALLLLKGYSHKRIADLTGRRERTVRQHAVVVYQKSGLAGRAELAAFFLEDVMLPEFEREDVAPLP
jgi:DNA-binding CsgD family transcriptional regulator